MTTVTFGGPAGGNMVASGWGGANVMYTLIQRPGLGPGGSLVQPCGVDPADVTLLLLLLMLVIVKSSPR